jgi:hypothetical protein
MILAPFKVGKLIGMFIYLIIFTLALCRICKLAVCFFCQKLNFLYIAVYRYSWCGMEYTSIIKSTVTGEYTPARL